MFQFFTNDYQRVNFSVCCCRLLIQGGILLDHHFQAIGLSIVIVCLLALKRSCNARLGQDKSSNKV